MFIRNELQRKSKTKHNKLEIRTYSVKAKQFIGILFKSISNFMPL